MNRKDFTLYIGETWTIDGTANDADGAPIDLTGGAVELRIVGPNGLAITLKSTSAPADILIADGTGGTYTAGLGASDARQDALVPGPFDYEVDAITANGAVSVQNAGKVTLVKSLRKAFP